MSKTKTAKAPRAAKSAKAPKGKTPGKATNKATTKVSGECPKGGSHQWSDEDGERFCTKCKEPASAKKPGKAKAKAERKPKKLSALDAAAQVLAASKEPMNCKALIETMQAKGLWMSPGGKTPAATLYSAIITEIGKKGKESRFVKVERGHFKISA